jgi:hypothetical protein
MAHSAVGVRRPTTPEQRPDRCFLPDLAELGPVRRIGPDPHTRVRLHPHPKPAAIELPLAGWGMNYKGKALKGMC